MKRSIPLALVLLAVAAVPAQAARTVNVPSALERPLAAAHAHTALPILLPDAITLDIRPHQRFYVSGGATKRAWDFEIAGAPHCGGATACFLASFTGERARTLGSKPNVRLVQGIPAHFQPLSCGGSCSPPSITWLVGGMRYAIQANVARPTRATFVRLANSALGAGGR